MLRAGREYFPFRERGREAAQTGGEGRARESLQPHSSNAPLVYGPPCLHVDCQRKSAYIVTIHFSQVSTEDFNLIHKHQP